MDRLASEDHSHIATEEEIDVYRSNWWIRSNFVGSDTMPIRHRADFKEALSTLRHLKNQEDTAYYQKWQSSSSSWWNWQDSWWHSSSEYHRDDGPNTDRSGKPAKQWLGQLFVERFSKLIWCRITVIFGNSQQQFTVTDGVCKEYTSKYRKFYVIWLRRKRQHRHEQWDQAWDQLQHQQQVKQQHAQQAHHLSVHVERTLSHLMSSHTSFGSRSESHHLSSMVICMGASPWVDSPLLLRPVLSCLLFLPPPALRAVPWARQPDRHGKPVQLSQQGEWRRLRRLHLPHTIVMQDFATQWIQSYLWKTKTSQETQRSLQKFLEADGKPKVIYTDNSLEFGKACEDHHTDRRLMGLLKEQCAEWKNVPLQYCCNQVWMKIGVQIPGNTLPICETFKISYLMGRLRDDTAHLMAQVLSPFITIFIPSMARSLWLDLSLLPLPFLPSLLRLLPLSRAVPWARQPDRHGKSALLRCRREWGHHERLPLSHKLWAQPPDLRRAQRLISPLLLHDPVLGPRHGWRDTRRDAHRKHTEDKPIAANQKACQSSSVVFDRSGKLDGERNVDQSLVFGVTRNPHSAHSKFSENTELRKWSIDQEIWWAK